MAEVDESAQKRWLVSELQLQLERDERGMQ